ncbi:hypothetical protein LZ838_08455 [Pseudomonas sp. AA27]|uniref:hypothetical protein n=1 Tax=Pseudomonas sp. AA27 TaxID=2908652 RepID=UPI001F1E1D4F|nr:hypothetical protein [Pseudomonas sp. AA27]MCF1487391.1 hypothetical protein [Pseudomonas sp. AA27]
MSARRMPSMAAIMFAFFALLVSFDALSGPNISTNWKSVAMDKFECLNRGEVVLSGLGYSPIKTQYSVFAEKSEITLMVRCDLPSLVFFIASRHSKLDSAHNFVELEELSTQF